MSAVKWIIFFLFLVIAESLPAENQLDINGFSIQDTTKKSKNKKRRENIEEIESTFAIRPIYNIQSNWLRVTPRRGDGTPFNYQPNVIGSAGGQIKIKGLVVTYKQKLPSNTESIAKRGQTDYLNLNLNILTRFVGVNLNYQDYKGFYYNPSSSFEFVNPADTMIQRPDLRAYTGGVKIDFIFTPSFSMKAAFAQTERQKKSAGSFMMMIGNRFTRYQMDSTMVPLEYQKDYTNFTGLGKGSFNTTNIALGLGFSYIRGNFNFTPVILTGLGVQLQFYDYYGVKKYGAKLPIYFQFKNAIGYNGQNFFARFVYSVELDNTPLKQARVSMFYLNAEVSLGVRFGDGGK